MKYLYAFFIGFFLTLPVWAQDIAPTENDQPAPVFPSELMLLPQSLQDAVDAETSAEDVEIPAGMSVADEAFYRAQVAYATEDWLSARLYAESAAIAGSAQAATLVGLIEQDGLVGEPNLVVASQWFQRAAEEDEPVSLYQLGVLAQQDHSDLDLGPSRPWFERSARAGHIGGMVAYAVALRASPIPQDMIEAREWAERSAQAGSSEGMYQLAQMLDAGEGGSLDIEGARIWFERAGNLQHAEAAFQAGMMWAAGEGGLQDDVEGLRWLRIAAESGYGPAMGQYGLMLYQGRGGEIDQGLAAYWFSQGAQSGDAESRFLYAYVLARGEGVSVDYAESYRWVLLGAVDAQGAPVHDPGRDQLQAGLEQALPMDEQSRIRDAVSVSR